MKANRIDFYQLFKKPKFRTNWNSLLMILSIFTAIEIPLRLALNLPNSIATMVIDGGLTILFLLDVAINSIQPVSEFNKSEEKERSIWDKQYFRTWFSIDLLAAIPFGILFSGINLESVQGLRALRLLKLMRLLKLAKLVPIIRKSKILKSINPSLVRMIIFLFFLSLAAHWMACLWIGLDVNSQNRTLVELYVRALYWVLTTMTTVGYGDIVATTIPQYLFTMILMILGAGTYGYVIANLSSYFGNIDTARSDFSRKMAIVNAFLAYREVPPDLEKKILSYYNYIWDNRLDHKEDEVINDLPVSLKLEVELFLRQPLISKVPVFQKANPDFKRDIVHFLQIHVYMPGDRIVTKGEKGNSMYFVSKGNVEILDESLGRIAWLGEGSFFGETSLLLEKPRNATVRAVSFCNIYSLDKPNFDLLISKYPDFQKEILKTYHIRKPNKIEKLRNSKTAKN